MMQFLHAENKDSDQIVQKRSLIWDFEGRTGQRVYGKDDLYFTQI